MLYFISNESNTAVKIGYTSNDPVLRLVDLQTAHYERLRLIAVTEGELEGERQLHSIFEDERLQGEWFRPSEYLMATIKFLGDEPTAAVRDRLIAASKIAVAARREARLRALDDQAQRAKDERAKRKVEPPRALAARRHAADLLYAAASAAAEADRLSGKSAEVLERHAAAPPNLPKAGRNTRFKQPAEYAELSIG